MTPAQLRPLFEAEAAGRVPSFSPEIASRIIRYGGVVGSRMERFDRRGRCMDYGRELIRQYEDAGHSFPSGTVLIAGELTAGKGRFARTWHAPEGGLWLTLILVNILLPEHARFLPLAVGVACCEAARHFGAEARLKWVNDVHVAKRKLSGVLIETERGPRFGEEYLLVGIGLNVNNGAFPPELRDSAVSLRQLLGRQLDLDEVAGQLLAKLAWNIGLLHHAEAEAFHAPVEESQAPHPILSRWLELSDTIGRKVLFGFDVQRDPLYEAVVEGLDPEGGLILRLCEDHATVVEHAGEILYLD
ncbi:MAG: biotin--[acetyl-CoA-carboxylase] ligase [Thermodesulfobacteriota bacterium]